MKDKLRNWSGWLFLTIVMFGLVSCSQSSDCFREDVLCAALVTDTQGIEDQGMNQDTWAGLEQAKADGIVDRVEYIESIDSRDYEKNIAYFADLGFDTIFTVGAGMDDETLRAADLYLDSVFVGINQPASESRPNLISVTFPEDQMGFLAGALAVRITETQVVGAVCETSGIDAMWRYCEGFRAGVTLANRLLEKNVTVAVVYREGGDREKLFLDEEWGAETAQGLIRRGADGIFAAGGATGLGALQAAAEAGAQTIGSESGLGGVTSVLGDASFEVRQVLGSAAPSGRIRYIPLGPKFPENLTGEINLLLASLQSAAVTTGVPPAKP